LTLVATRQFRFACRDKPKALVTKPQLKFTRLRPSPGLNTTPLFSADVRLALARSREQRPRAASTGIELVGGDTVSV
jgi:hypothetical protein